MILLISPNMTNKLTDTTVFIFPNQGGYLLQNWKIVFNDRKAKDKKINIDSSKTDTSNPNTGKKCYLQLVKVSCI